MSTWNDVVTGTQKQTMIAAVKDEIELLRSSAALRDLLQPGVLLGSWEEGEDRGQYTCRLYVLRDGRVVRSGALMEYIAPSQPSIGDDDLSKAIESARLTPQIVQRLRERITR